MPPSATATTVYWDRQAFGQQYSINCSSGTEQYAWPNNSNWSQSQQLGTDCNGNPYATQPSNWSITNYPNGPGYDVVLGNAGGTPTTLDVNVTLTA